MRGCGPCCTQSRRCVSLAPLRKGSLLSVTRTFPCTPPAGLSEVRALAKAAPPVPGSLPPSALPRLQPLAPQHLLLLPPPSQPSQPLQLPLYHIGRRQPVCVAAAREGCEGEQAVEAADVAGPATTTTSTNTTTTSSSMTSASSALFGGPPAHPHLEDQLTAVAQWEQVGGRLRSDITDFYCVG